MYKRIVVAIGDYPDLDTAVAYAIALAADTDAELWSLNHRQRATAGPCGHVCWWCMTALLEQIWRSSML